MTLLLIGLWTITIQLSVNPCCAEFSCRKCIFRRLSTWLVTPVHSQWSYSSLALSHRFAFCIIIHHWDGTGISFGIYPYGKHRPFILDIPYYGCWWPGGRINIKMSSEQYRKSHCGDKTILRLSYLHNGISYTDKMTFLYWIKALATQGTLMDYVKVSLMHPSSQPKVFVLWHLFIGNDLDQNAAIQGPDSI